MRPFIRFCTLFGMSYCCWKPRDVEQRVHAVLACKTTAVEIYGWSSQLLVEVVRCANGLQAGSRSDRNLHLGVKPILGVGKYILFSWNYWSISNSQSSPRIQIMTFLPSSPGNKDSLRSLQLVANPSLDVHLTQKIRIPHSRYIISHKSIPDVARLFGFRIYLPLNDYYWL